jgi:aminopeptidase
MLSIEPKMQASLDKYADVILQIGLGFTAGQRLHIGVFTEFEYLTPEIIYLIRKLAETAYKLGAKNVITDWSDGELEKLRLQHGSLASLEDIPPLAPEQRERFIDDNGAFLSIGGRNPDLLDDVDQERLQLSRKTRSKAFRTVNQRIARNDVTWLVVNVPVSSWATKVYPGLPDAEAVKQLWHQIFKLSRVAGDNPVADWQQHISDIHQRSVYLNKKQYAELRYKGPGTDLHVGLPHDHYWEGAGSVSKSGIQFVPNIPTEEIFTMPDCRKINGTVSATFPFAAGGKMVEGMVLTFVDGHVTEAHATKNQEALESLLNQDEGARSLGEVALVPNSSPISQSKTIYHDTLFDENAACHMALGNAYPISLVGGALLSEDELKARGANSSAIHNDFMIGSGKLDIDGVTGDGTVEPIMRAGEWAFTV